MSLEFKEQQNLETEKLISNLLSDAPIYVKDFYDKTHHGKRKISTQLSYLRDIINFLKFEQTQIPDLKEIPFSELPCDFLGLLKTQDLNEYRSYLKTVLGLANASCKKQFASISVFFNFLNGAEYIKNNPMINFEVPAVNKKKIIKLDSGLSNRLLNGILANDKYLIQADDLADNYVVDIQEDIWLKRERLVLRNYAICCLFLGSGLRVSELVGLDLQDINFRHNSVTIIAKGGDEVEVFFGEEVSNALKDYLNGLPLPSDIIEKYKYSHPEEVEWVKTHKLDANFIKNIEKEWKNMNETMKRDMIKLRYSLLRQGRSSLLPKRGCEAVFITTRGTRMSVRSVELMIKEMVQTYLPDYEDKDKFSPHKLRATCATRILKQTGNIQLASTQLNHKGIQVTSAFYAELQKEEQKEQIKNLDINEW